MSHTYEELHGMTVAQLRDLAKETEHDGLVGYSTMHKEELLTKLCAALEVEAHVHHEVVGVDKAAVKSGIRALKQEREKALQSGDKKELKRIRREIHRLKRTLRRATV
jgi:CII-binding regulator of phage lambda lysogenization HflD